MFTLTFFAWSCQSFSLYIFLHYRQVFFSSSFFQNALFYINLFQVGQQRFPAHKVIAAAGSKELHKLIKSLPSNEDTVHLLDTEPTIFAQILEYMYTGSCSLLVPGKCSERYTLNFTVCYQMRT